jgi:hypothetical protein
VAERKPTGDARLKVLVASAAAVAVVLGVQVLTYLVPPIGEFVGASPFVVAVLVVGTLLVLTSTVLASRRR